MKKVDAVIGILLICLGLTLLYLKSLSILTVIAIILTIVYRKNKSFHTICNGYPLYIILIGICLLTFNLISVYASGLIWRYVNIGLMLISLNLMVNIYRNEEALKKQES